MTDKDDKRRKARDEERDETRGPRTWSDMGGSLGSADDRSSENRREGLEKDHQRRRHGDAADQVENQVENEE